MAFPQAHELFSNGQQIWAIYHKSLTGFQAILGGIPLLKHHLGCDSVEVVINCQDKSKNILELKCWKRIRHWKCQENWQNMALSKQKERNSNPHVRSLQHASFSKRLIQMSPMSQEFWLNKQLGFGNSDPVKLIVTEPEQAVIKSILPRLEGHHTNC